MCKVLLLGAKALVPKGGSFFLIIYIMKKYILLLLPALAFVGCDIQKEASKRKTETSLTQDYEQRQYRPSAEVLYRPPANIVLRDTTIVVVNSEGSKIRLQYDKDGNMREAECLPALIELVTKITSQMEQTEKDKQKSKTEEFSTTWILYIVIGFMVVVCFALFLMQRSVSKNSQVVNAILSKIVNT